jgi:CheY-like chemotaxis protein
MPKMDGYQLLKEIKQHKIDLKNFVFITAHVDVSKEEIVELGATDILYKPISHRKLQEYLRSIK